MNSSRRVALMSVVCFFVLLCCSAVSAQLSPTFYSTICPTAQRIVRALVRQAVANEKRMGASLLRLHFHDCFVNGCDGSVLLDDTQGFTGEKNAGPNANSLRGFEVIDKIKGIMERVCVGVVSCADILAIAARDSVVELGGPGWVVNLGRRDARTASQNAANTNLPGTFFSLNNLISSFQSQGLSANDMIALSGGHTIGQARCTAFRTRLYNEANMNQVFASSLKATCPRTAGNGDNNLTPFDASSPNLFDNGYYTNLRSQKGLLHSDQQLFNGGSADALVSLYSANQTAFFNDFAAAMVKMGNIKPLTGNSGEIRKNCRRWN
ncbi:hypothetical protein SUGI_0236810 [Cryptomeria japonica]|uniref:peroxidase P7-like n=1 Tax=Cryptomeria japonica TaxID=3369 RepID=UPI002408C20A|nr:peroxidase P7-like [Cryptomeria japonica]GLJ14638.1 hypothetical protein SUGI_0236810 [Cryptomeria japonica]